MGCNEGGYNEDDGCQLLMAHIPRMVTVVVGGGGGGPGGGGRSGAGRGPEKEVLRTCCRSVENDFLPCSWEAQGRVALNLSKIQDMQLRLRRNLEAIGTLNRRVRPQPHTHTLASVCLLWWRTYPSASF